MTKLLQSIQIATVLFFVGFLIYTIVGMDHIKSLAREFINLRIESTVSKSVALAEELMRDERVSKYLGEDRIAAAEGEIRLYRSSPQDYIRAHTAENAVLPEQDNSGDPTLDAPVKKLMLWRTRIKEQFRASFENILRDLRIFSISNIVGALLALWMTTRTQRIGTLPARVTSIILTGAVFYTVILYVDQNWFLNVLLNAHLGYAYPVLLIFVFGYFQFRFSRALSAFVGSPEKSDSASVGRK